MDAAHEEDTDLCMRETNAIEGAISTAEADIEKYSTLLELDRPTLEDR